MTGNRTITSHQCLQDRSSGGWLLLALVSAIGGFSGLVYGIHILTIGGLLGGILASTGLATLVRYRSRNDEQARGVPLQVLAEFSHEARTPISAMLGFADLLDDADPARRRAHLRTIRANGLHALRLLDDVLVHAGMTLKAPATRILPVDMRTLARQACDTHAPAAAKKGIAIAMEVAEAVPETIETDSTRLLQVINNLLVNAVKFTDRGEIVLSVEYDRTRGELCCAVRDTGIGVASHRLSRIFDPFQQDAPTSSEGSGLGLHISRDIAEGLGGSLQARSTPGLGSTFTLRIPATEAADETATFRSAQSQLSGRRILLAEDCPDNRRLVRCLLGQSGARVIEAENGREALFHARNCPVELVILDMNMPVMNGEETARQLRLEGHHGPILALTAHASDLQQEALDGFRFK